MKILLIAPQPFYEKRGTPLAVGLLCAAFGELNHEVDLLTYHLGEDRVYPAVRHFRSCTLSFVRKVKKGLSGTKLFLDIFIFVKAIQLLRTNHYDCIHGVEEGALMGVLLKRMFGLPLVYDMDSSIPEQIRDSRSPLWARFPFPELAERLEKWGIANADMVLAVCLALQEKAQAIAPDVPVHVLEDIPVSEKAPITLQADCHRIIDEFALADRQCVVYTGTFEEYQGIDLLLESIPLVLQSVPSACFILVGGLAEQVPPVKARVISLGIEGNVRIVGRRPLEEMPAFMAVADVLVSPRSLGINTPMKLYSYLQSGKPVVATRLQTHTQVLDDSTALLALPVPDAFSAAITRLLGDKELRDKLGQAGVELIENNFTFAAFKNKLKKAYERFSQCSN